MTIMDPKLERQLRMGFKWFNRYMILHWRLGLGPYGNRTELSGQIMVLTHTGRKSGKHYRTPLNYVIVNEDVYCMSGAGQVSDWFRNLKANPAVEIWLPHHGWWAGVAEEVVGAENYLDLMRAVLIASGFAARVAGLAPRKMSDEELAAAAASYRLVCIRRTHARTGPGGPGDLAWIWPLATMILLPLALFRRRR